MKKLKKWQIAVISILSLLIIILCVISFFQIVHFESNSDNPDNPSNDYDIEHEYDDLHEKDYTKDEVMEIYQKILNEVNQEDINNVSEHTEDFAILVIRVMNLKAEEMELIDEATQQKIVELAILGYQVRGIDLQPLTSLFNGKYENIVKEAMEKGFTFPDSSVEETPTETE